MTVSNFLGNQYGGYGGYGGNEELLDKRLSMSNEIFGFTLCACRLWKSRIWRLWRQWRLWRLWRWTPSSSSSRINSIIISSLCVTNL